MKTVTLKNPERLREYKDSGAEGIIVGIERFSSRSDTSLTAREIKTLSEEARKLDLKIFVNLLKPVYEKELDELKDLLVELKDFVDGFYISDEGILQLASELNMEDQMIFTSETLITSALDALFYLSLGVQAVSLAHDISLDEIKAIASRSDPSRLEVLIHGHFAYLESRRSLLENYMRYSDQDFVPKENRIRENTRKEWYPIKEDEQGTVVYSDLPKNSYEQIRILDELGIDRFRIDGILMDEDQLIAEINNYKEILEGKKISEENKSGSDAVYSSKIVLRKNDETK